VSALTDKKAVDIKIRNVTKWYGEAIALNRVSLDIKEGELFTLLGPSGCGKTTTLRIIAGLTNPDEGQIYIGGKMVNDIPAWQRGTALVFQSYAVWPFMSVFDNIAYGLKLKKISKKEIKEKVKQVMSMLGLDGMEKRRPDQLSGGQLQRVALARALVVESPVLLLDEPLSNLDAKVRMEVRQEIRRLQRMLGITMVYVTHDQEEALVISDRIALMNEGTVEQVGSPLEIYGSPETPFTASFIGITTSMKGRILGKKGNIATVEVGEGVSIKGKIDERIKPGEEVMLFVRPEDIEIRSLILTPGSSAGLEGEISQVTFIGSMIRYKVKISKEKTLTCEVHNPRRYKILKEGSRVMVNIDPRDVTVIPR
jgi:ABC-type Fe3+/spermidine/putrescine transport system ATPase subunit